MGGRGGGWDRERGGRGRDGEAFPRRFRGVSGGEEGDFIPIIYIFAQMKNAVMETPKVSIIVPVYNAGKYLAPLLDSLVGQTLREIEVILVLDCPTDGSDRVAEEYAARDGRVVIVRNRENLHVGFSRNEGLKVARGEYIGFCDHDDLVEPEMFKKLYNRGKETGAEVVLADFWIGNETNKYQAIFPRHLTEEEFIRQSFSELVNVHPRPLNKESMHCHGVIWMWPAGYRS